MQVGDTLYYFDQNRRKYSKPPPGSDRIWGDIIYAEHFAPEKIIGETRVSWCFEYGRKAKKSDPTQYGFYTAEQMADKIYEHDNGYKISDLVRHAPAKHLKQIAEIIGYVPQSN